MSAVKSTTHVVVLVCLMLLNYVSAAKDVCKPCSSANPTKNQCSLPAQCHRGHCSMDLNRCSAEYFNAKFKSNIDLSYWDREEQLEAVREKDFPNNVHYRNNLVDHEGSIFKVDSDKKQLIHVPSGKAIQYNDNLGFYEVNPKIQQHQTTHINSAEDSETENAEFATDSLDNLQFDETAEVNSAAAGIHVHIGCGKCNRKVYCENHSYCTKFHANAYCYKQPVNALAGWCKLRIPTWSGGIFHVDEFCCEWD